MILRDFARRWLYLPLAAGLAIVVPGALAVWSHELVLFGSRIDGEKPPAIVPRPVASSPPQRAGMTPVTVL